MELTAWLQVMQQWPEANPSGGQRWLLSLAVDARVLPPSGAVGSPLTLLSGPEGGLSPAEETAARNAGFQPITLGPRVLRAETAPLAALSRWADPSVREGTP